MGKPVNIQAPAKGVNLCGDAEGKTVRVLDVPVLGQPGRAGATAKAKLLKPTAKKSRISSSWLLVP